MPFRNGHDKDSLNSSPSFRRSKSRSSWKFRRDHRERLPAILARFTGYRSPMLNPPYDPLPFAPFTCLAKLPLKYEIWILGFIGAFGGILLIEAIMSSSTAFRDVYHTPVIITSFGASAVLLFGVVESPLSQPRNCVFGHFLSALVATCITRLFVLNPNYRGYLENETFHTATYLNGGLSMAAALLVMQVTGTAHPPGGATAINAAVQAQVVALSWRYLPVILSSSLIMFGWALVINNVGRRRYPLHWWAPGRTMVQEPDEDLADDANLSDVATLRQVEEGVIIEKRQSLEEGELRRENTPGALANLEPESRTAKGLVEPPSLQSAMDDAPEYA